MLTEQGTLVLPDFLVNAGGIICATVEYSGGDKPMAFKTILKLLLKNGNHLPRGRENQRIRAINYYLQDD